MRSSELSSLLANIANPCSLSLELALHARRPVPIRQHAHCPVLTVRGEWSAANRATQARAAESGSARARFGLPPFEDRGSGYHFAILSRHQPANLKVARHPTDQALTRPSHASWTDPPSGGRDLAGPLDGKSVVCEFRAFSPVWRR